MTDLNLKAVRVKQVIAMFMAVCLTVLSVNVDIFAAPQTKEAVDYYFGYAEAEKDITVNAMGITTSPDGTPSENVVPYTGDVEVFLDGDNDIFEIKGYHAVVSAQDGIILDQKVTVSVNANINTAERTDEAKIVYVPDDEDSDAAFVQTVKVAQEAAPVEDVVSKDNGDSDKDFIVTSWNGDVTDPASPYNGVSVSISENDWKDAYYVNSLDVVSAEDGGLKAGVKTVTFYDGLKKTIKNFKADGTKADALLVGSPVAYVSTTADVIDNNKTSRIAALEQAYVTGQYFAGYAVLEQKNLTNAKGKVTKTAYVTAFDGALKQYNEIPTSINNNGVIAIAKYASKTAINANLYATVKMEVKSTAAVQMDVASATVSEDSNAAYKATGKYTADVTLVVPGKAGKNITAKKVITKATVNAKTGVVTLKSGAVTTLNGVDSYVTINRMFKKDGEKKAVAVPVGIVNVTVAGKGTLEAITSIDLAGLYGESYANVNIAQKQAVKVVAKTAPYSTTVKFVATKTPLTNGTFDNMKKLNQEINKAKKGATVAVNANGTINAKKAGTSTVYAYVVTKNAEGKFNLVVSNAFTVNVSKTTANFNVVKNVTLKYNDAKKAKDRTCYVVKKADKKVSYAVKGVAADATDYVSMKVLNKEGKVVLGALQKATNKQNKTIAYKYTISLAKGATFTSDNDLYIVGQAPNGTIKGAKLAFKK